MTLLGKMSKFSRNKTNDKKISSHCKDRVFEMIKSFAFLFSADTTNYVPHRLNTVWKTIEKGSPLLTT